LRYSFGALPPSSANLAAEVYDPVAEGQMKNGTCDIPVCRKIELPPIVQQPGGGVGFLQFCADSTLRAGSRSTPGGRNSPAKSTIRFVKCKW